LVEQEIQWARIAPGKFVVASPSRVSLHEEVGTLEGPFSSPPQGPASLEATRMLLDGSIGLAQREPVLARAPQPLTKLRWVYRLAGYFQTTHATPKLMIEASQRFREQGRGALAAWAEMKSRDERGHDELALRDLKALGYDAEALVQACVPETAAALVEFFTALVRCPEDGAGCVGYAYSLERLAATRSAAEITAVQNVLGSNIDATRCLRVHSAAGSDASHVDDIVALAAGLSFHERERISRAAYETTLLARTPRGPALGEDDLAALFAPFHRVASA